MKLLLSISCLALAFCVSAQQTGKIEYKQLGISFTVPDGWVGQEGEGVFLIASQTEPGFILVTTHGHKTLDAIKAEARQGIQDANGTNLQLEGDLETLSKTAVAGNYNGTVEWQAARCYAVGMLNPHGYGVSILAVAATNIFSDKYKQLALKVKNSVKFAKPEIGPEVEKWKNLLSGVKLTYMESYSSNSYTDGGVSGGYSINKELDLCSQGYFLYYGSSNVSLGSDVSSAYNSSNKGGHGEWEIAQNASGGPILRLNFYNGEVWEYNLSLIDEKVHLNGSRYFRTWTGEYAPNCGG